MAMSNKQRIPKQSLRFIGQATVLASKHGLRKGLTKAAAKANPVLIVLDAAISVAKLYYFIYQDAKMLKQKETLRKELKQLLKQLQAERDKLQTDIDAQLDNIKLRQEQKEIIRSSIDIIRQEIPKAMQHLGQLKQEHPEDLTSIETHEKELYRNIQRFSEAFAIYQSLHLTDNT